VTRNPNLEGDITFANQHPLQHNSNYCGERPYSWWTGKLPEWNLCPGINQNGKISSLALPNLKTCTRQELMDYFDNTWTLTEILFSALQSPEAFYIAPYHQLRHPLIFYYCHPVSLYVNKLLVAGLIDQPINPYFERLFETGVDEMSWDDLSKNQMKWPAIEEIIIYRKQVYQLIKNLIETHPALDKRPITMEDPLWALVMGFEHERIHLETSSVLIRELPIHLVRRPKQWPDSYPLQQNIATTPKQGRDYPENTVVEITEGQITIGKPTDWPSFGWDNEYGSYEATVPSFRVNRFLISNGEFWEFIVSGGYQHSNYWSEEGWQWRTFRNAKCPTFWVSDGPAGSHQYKLRLCFEIIPMQWSWPVNINFHEAKAFCKWRSEKDRIEIPYRLMTEVEHHRMRDATSHDPIMKNTSQDMLKKNMNLNLAYGSETPVNAMTTTQQTCHDVFGNLWEWCEDHFAALPGFEVHPFYDDFSSPCFDGKHQLITGGSFISTGDEASQFARFHFRPHFFQHVGCRLVQPLEETNILQTTCLDAPPPHVGTGPCCARSSSLQTNTYETQLLLDQYLLLHYGNAEDTIPHHSALENAIAFPKRCAQLLMEIAKKHGISTHRALDLGCAVGGSTFELSRTFSEVIGIDLSASFIKTANKLKHEGNISYSRKEEGEIYSELSASIDPNIDRARVHFQIGDACALPSDFEPCDAVLLANLLCRLPSPKSCLTRMGGTMGIVKIGGIVLIASPYSWLKTYTPPVAWLGGRVQDGKNILSTEGLHSILDEHFELLSEINMPLIIREHARKFEYIISHAMVWRRIK
jgi:5-histidylcysteine sulfoxide synthase/putative 4-mercaptohistidine N1-methyltranferase